MELRTEIINRLAPDSVLVLANLDDPKVPKSWREDLANLIDDMGRASAVAQGLPAPVTTASKMYQGSEQKIYLLIKPSAESERSSVIGLLKVGRKDLILIDANNRHVEVNPLCVLDFYVNELHQRKGHGQHLMEYMLQAEDVKSHQLAFDRPSSKFLSFLAKYYFLTDYISQSNNFVVFLEFGLERLPSARRSGRRTSRRSSAAVKLPQIETRKQVVDHDNSREISYPTAAVNHLSSSLDRRGRRTNYGRRNILQNGCHYHPMPAIASDAHQQFNESSGEQSMPYERSSIMPSIQNRSDSNKNSPMPQRLDPGEQKPVQTTNFLPRIPSSALPSPHQKSSVTFLNISGSIQHQRPPSKYFSSNTKMLYS